MSLDHWEDIVSFFDPNFEELWIFPLKSDKSSIEQSVHCTVRTLQFAQIDEGSGGITSTSHFNMHSWRCHVKQTAGAAAAKKIIKFLELSHGHLNWKVAVNEATSNSHKANAF